MEKSFRRGFWGYRGREVDQFIVQLKDDFAMKLQAKEAEQEELSRINTQIKEDLDKLQIEIKKYQEKEKAVAEVIIQAQLQATAIEEEAKNKAKALEEAALAEINLKRKELDTLRNQFTSVKEELKQVINKYKTMLEEPVEA